MELSEKIQLGVWTHTEKGGGQRLGVLICFKDLGPLPSRPHSYYIASGSVSYTRICQKHTKPPCLVKLVSAGLQSLGAKNSD